MHLVVHFDRSPNQGALEEIDYRKAIVIVVVAGGAELAVATAKDLRLLQEELVAHGVADPKRGIGIDVHRGGLEFLQQILIVLNDFEHFLDILRLRKRETVIAVTNKKLVMVVLAEGLAIHYPYLVAIELAQHLDKDTALPVGSLTNADITRCNVLHISNQAALFQGSLLFRQGGDFAYSPVVFSRFHILVFICFVLS